MATPGRWRSSRGRCPPLAETLGCALGGFSEKISISIKPVESLTCSKVNRSMEWNNGILSTYDYELG